MEKSELRVYISGAFTGLDDLYQTLMFYDDLANELVSHGFIVYKPHEHTGPLLSEHHSCITIYNKDLKEISNSDALICILDEPSHGVGIEIHHAMTEGKDILGFFRSKRGISRLAIGLLKDYEKGYCAEYTCVDEIGLLCKKILLAGITEAPLHLLPHNK